MLQNYSLKGLTKLLILLALSLASAFALSLRLVHPFLCRFLEPVPTSLEAERELKSFLLLLLTLELLVVGVLGIGVLGLLLAVSSEVLLVSFSLLGVVSILLRVVEATKFLTVPLGVPRFRFSWWQKWHVYTTLF